MTGCCCQGAHAHTHAHTLTGAQTLTLARTSSNIARFITTGILLSHPPPKQKWQLCSYISSLQIHKHVDLWSMRSDQRSTKSLHREKRCPDTVLKKSVTTGL